MGAEARRIITVSWSVLGVVALLAEPAVRLGAAVVRRLQQGLGVWESASVVAAVLVLGYVEGYRGFRCSFGPRVVERAFDLAAAPSAACVLLGPLHAMSLLGDTRARVTRAWALVGLILTMVVAVRHLPAVARCSVDAGVAVSLLWGVVEILLRFATRLASESCGPRAMELSPRVAVPRR